MTLHVILVALLNVSSVNSGNTTHIQSALVISHSQVEAMQYERIPMEGSIRMTMNGLEIYINGKWYRLIG